MAKVTVLQFGRWVGAPDWTSRWLVGSSMRRTCGRVRAMEANTTRAWEGVGVRRYVVWWAEVEADQWSGAESGRR